MAKVKKKQRSKFKSRYARELKDKVEMDNRAVDELLALPLFKEANAADAVRWLYCMYQGTIDNLDEKDVQYVAMPQIVSRYQVPHGWCLCRKCVYRTNIKKDVYGSYSECSVCFDEDGNRLLKCNTDGCTMGREGEPIRNVT